LATNEEEIKSLRATKGKEIAALQSENAELQSAKKTLFGEFKKQYKKWILRRASKQRFILDVLATCFMTVIATFRVVDVAAGLFIRVLVPPLLFPSAPLMLTLVIVVILPHRFYCYLFLLLWLIFIMILVVKQRAMPELSNLP
jgi:hypothetical protein